MRLLLEVAVEEAQLKLAKLLQIRLQQHLVSPHQHLHQ